MPTLIVPFVVPESKLKQDNKYSGKSDKVSLYGIKLGPTTDVMEVLSSKLPKSPSFSHILHEELALLLHLVNVMKLPTVLLIGLTGQRISSRNSKEDLEVQWFFPSLNYHYFWTSHSSLCYKFWLTFSIRYCWKLISTFNYSLTTTCMYPLTVLILLLYGNQCNMIYCLINAWPIKFQCVLRIWCLVVGIIFLHRSVMINSQLNSLVCHICIRQYFCAPSCSHYASSSPLIINLPYFLSSQFDSNTNFHQVISQIGEHLASVSSLGFSREKMVQSPTKSSKDAKEAWRALYGWCQIAHFKSMKVNYDTKFHFSRQSAYTRKQIILFAL